MESQSPVVKSRRSISIVVIAKDEADRIGKLLKSAEFGDEIIVVDSGSTDGTQHICENAGAHIIHQDWMGYVDQKQFAMEAANCDWILSLDADEWLSEEGAKEIVSAIENAKDDVAAFAMPRLSFYLNRWIRHGGWYPDTKIRLVRKDHGRWVGDGIHEKLDVDGKIVRLNHPILHAVYRNISDQVRTMNSFSTVYSENRGRPGSMWYLLYGLIHSLGKFLECYVWKLGFLDGLPGLVIAVNSSYYVFLKHAKSWEKSLTNTLDSPRKAP